MPFGRVPSVLSAGCSLRAGSVDRCWVASLSCHAGSVRSRTRVSPVVVRTRARVSRNASGTLWGSNRGAIRCPQVFVMNLRGTTGEPKFTLATSVRWEREHLYSLALRRNKTQLSPISCSVATYSFRLSSCLFRCPLIPVIGGLSRGRFECRQGASLREHTV